MERIDLLVRVLSPRATHPLLFQVDLIKEGSDFTDSENGRLQSTPFIKASPVS